MSRWTTWLCFSRGGSRLYQSFAMILEPINADPFGRAQPLPFDICESLAVPRPKNTQDFTSVGSQDFAMR